MITVLDITMKPTTFETPSRVFVGSRIHPEAKEILKAKAKEEGISFYDILRWIIESHAETLIPSKDHDCKGE